MVHDGRKTVRDRRQTVGDHRKSRRDRRNIARDVPSARSTRFTPRVTGGVTRAAVEVLHTASSVYAPQP